MADNIYLFAGVFALQYRLNMVELSDGCFFKVGSARIEQYIVRKRDRNRPCRRVKGNIVPLPESGGLGRAFLTLGNLSLEFFDSLLILRKLLAKPALFRSFTLEQTQRILMFDIQGFIFLFERTEIRKTTSRSSR